MNNEQFLHVLQVSAEFGAEAGWDVYKNYIKDNQEELINLLYQAASRFETRNLGRTLPVITNRQLGQMLRDAANKLESKK